MNPGLSPRLRSIVLAVIVVAALCGGTILVVSSRETKACHDGEDAIAARVHVDTEPVSAALQPLGDVSEVHWAQRLGGGACDHVPQSQWYERVGVARIDPAAAVDLGKVNPWDAAPIRGGAAPDPRLAAWLPKNPHWRHSSLLDAAYAPSMVTHSDTDYPDDVASYLVDPDTGLVYFICLGTFDPAGGPQGS